ncbi:hypothetical protein KC343_g12947 [Hortaea werneckii]|uniref:Uncharacterized protein n=1 Tax=Hortaea werneckii TaxID=91943 RepID=A0A3M7C4B4_HORWE|nr:hypothetical protein KC352_g23616 [Hortaea werneckii]KAI7555101.1 hypothetical protein KC317_g13097 [Hortaea werneckii]KAI7600781.1 hypothetical protein KC346_g13128 [Hortaea werneckii]KAI7607782.1 hypothetical protein KC343_g12947 [Hortaea werneckii]KAI7658368.1 hypothetical protein KC319_g9255 [Hortaea werneckii]
MPEQSEDHEVLAAAAILMRMYRAEDSEPGEDSDATATPAPRGGNHGTISNAAGWQRVSQAARSFHVQSLREQEDREMMDVDERSLYKNDHAASSGIFEGQKPGEVYRPEPQPLTYYIPTGSSGREQRTIPRSVDFNSAESVLDADETRRLAAWRRESSWSAAGFRPDTFWRGYTKGYDNHMVAQHVTYLDQSGGHQIPWGISVEQSNLWLPNQNRMQQSVSSYNNRDKKPTSVREGYTGN